MNRFLKRRLSLPLAALASVILTLLPAVVEAQRAHLGERLTQSDQARRGRVDDRGTDRSGRVQLASTIEPLSARRPLRRLSVFSNRQAAGAGLRPEMEVDKSRCDCPRTVPLLGGAGMAGSSGAQSAGVAMKTAAIPLAVAFGVASRIGFA